MQVLTRPSRHPRDFRCPESRAAAFWRRPSLSASAHRSSARADPHSRPAAASARYRQRIRWSSVVRHRSFASADRASRLSVRVLVGSSHQYREEGEMSLPANHPRAVSDGPGAIVRRPYATSPPRCRKVTHLARAQRRCSVPGMSGAMKRLGIDRLDVEQRLALIEEIWESIDAQDSAALQLSDAQRAELQARLAEDEASPEDIITLEQVEESLPLPRGRK
jgi:putative addiction module component (TIGR02574 family)